MWTMIQSNRALYNDLAMESLTLEAWTQKQSEKSILASESPEHCVMWDYKKSIQIIHMKISGATK